MKMTKLAMATAVLMATAAISSPASATINVDQDITNITTHSFTDSFVVTGIDKGAFSTSFGVTTTAPGVFDIQVILNESVNGITSLSALLNGQNITLTKQAGNNWYGELSQAITSAGTQIVSLSGTSNGNSKLLQGSISFAAATPEPAAWVLMIAGLGVVGGVMRRKRSLADNQGGNFALA